MVHYLPCRCLPPNPAYSCKQDQTTRTEGLLSYKPESLWGFSHDLHQTARFPSSHPRNPKDDPLLAADISGWPPAWCPLALSLHKQPRAAPRVSNSAELSQHISLMERRRAGEPPRHPPRPAQLPQGKARQEWGELSTRGKVAFPTQHLPSHWAGRQGVVFTLTV